jgi:hypothetical protein
MSYSVDSRQFTRRYFFGKTAGGLGAAALATLLSQDSQAAGRKQTFPNFAPKAKRVIYLF